MVNGDGRDVDVQRVNPETRSQQRNWFQRRIDSLTHLDWLHRLGWVISTIIGGAVTSILMLILNKALGVSTAISLSGALGGGFLSFVLLTALYEGQQHRELVDVKFELNTTREELENKKRHTEEQLKREIDSCKDIYETRLRNISDAIKAAVWGLDVDYRYEYCIFTYSIGKTDDDDRWHRKYKIVAPNKRVVVAKDMKFGGRGLKVQGLSSYEDLHTHSNIDKGKLIIVHRPDRENSKEWWADIFFLPPVERGDSREFEVSGEYPYLWASLRTEGKDTATVELNKPADLFEIRIHIPYSLGTVHDTAHSPNEGEIKIKDDPQHEQHILTWTIKNAKAITYELDLAQTKDPTS